jgi:hypothetical protein
MSIVGTRQLFSPGFRQAWWAEQIDTLRDGGAE